MFKLVLTSWLKALPRSNSTDVGNVHQPTLGMGRLVQVRNEEWLHLHDVRPSFIFLVFNLIIYETETKREALVWSLRMMSKSLLCYSHWYYTWTCLTTNWRVCTKTLLGALLTILLSLLSMSLLSMSLLSMPRLHVLKPTVDYNTVCVIMFLSTNNPLNNLCFIYFSLLFMY